jgi:hypothetical protein
LWKAFQEDDGETALRAYQASREELVQWLQEEEEERQKAEEMREQAALLLEAAKTTMGSSKVSWIGWIINHHPPSVRP